jgi:N-formylglutamate amidohydrolase
MKKLVLHIPHSSTVIPVTSGYVVSEETRKQEMVKLTDWYTDDLFGAGDHVIIRAGFSRIFCDVERFMDDSQEIMAQYGMGLLYTKLDSGEPLRLVDSGLRKQILDEYYLPHHRNLARAVNQQLDLFHEAVIVDCHSFPDRPLTRDLDQEPSRPDFNIGTDPFHTPSRFIDRSMEFFEKHHYSLGIDRPYRGTIVPLEHYGKNPDVRSIMLEINRRIYMDETTTRKSENYPLIRRVVGEYLAMIREAG